MRFTTTPQPGSNSVFEWNKVNVPSMSSYPKQEIPSRHPKAKRIRPPGPPHPPPARVSLLPGAHIVPMHPTKRPQLPPPPRWRTMRATSHCLQVKMARLRPLTPLPIIPPHKSLSAQWLPDNHHSYLHSSAEPQSREEVEALLRPQERPTLRLRA